MSVSTFNDIIKYTDSLTLDEQLRLAAYLIEKARQTPTWQNLRGLVALGKEPQTFLPENRWQAFFESTERPTEDFMQERIDLPPQTREIF